MLKIIKASLPKKCKVTNVKYLAKDIKGKKNLVRLKKGNT